MKTISSESLEIDIFFEVGAFPAGHVSSSLYQGDIRESKDRLPLVSGSRLGCSGVVPAWELAAFPFGSPLVGFEERRLT